MGEIKKVVSSLALRKGQFTSSEFLIIIVVLISLFVASIGAWNFTSLKIKEKIDITDLELTAFDISDQLIKSIGEPTDWEENKTIFALGLVKSDYILDGKKVDGFTNLTSNQIINALGTSKYNIYFRLVDPNGTALVKGDGNKIESGVKPLNVIDIVNMRRIAIFNKEIVYMDVMLWR